MNLSRIVGPTALALALGLAIAIPSPAAAHSDLLSQTPGDGEAIETAPASVLLEYNEDIIDAGIVVQVNDAQGQNWSTGAPVVIGRQVEQPVDASAPAGDYDVIWRVVSADGHPIEGAFPFTVTTGPPVPTSEPEPVPTETDTPSPSASEPDPTATPAVASDEGNDSTALVIGLTLVAIALPFVGIAVVRAIRKRRS